MEVSMSLNALVRLPNSSGTSSPSRRLHHQDEQRLIKHSLFSTKLAQTPTQWQQLQKVGGGILVVNAKGKRAGGQDRRFQRPPPPPMPKIEEDGNPRFVIFIRMANVYLWYPLSIVAGGTTAKIMVAAKDNFLGKYIYKDTLARNLAAVIYKDEKEVQKTAIKQHRVLRSAAEFRYGYKLVVIILVSISLGDIYNGLPTFVDEENGNMRAAVSTNDVIELPRQEELKTVLDKVKDFFGDAKESFGKLTSLESTTNTAPEEKSNQESKVKS